MHSPISTIADTEDRRLARRRRVVALLCLASMAALALAMDQLLERRGWSAAAIVFMAIYLLSLPWTLLGFWNAVIGFVILRTVRDPLSYTNPAIARTPADSPIVTRTAICLCVRNEDVAATFARLGGMMESVAATGWGASFAFHVLSDTSRAVVAAAEAEAIATYRARFPATELHYRRRADNAGYKAGNLEEFASRCGTDYDHMIVLDADSVMSGRAMLRLVRAMQANPALGILQTLVVGTPAESAFTRIFQFGMRHGMHVQTIGSAWWQGRAGPYWGHNAIIRIAPFVDHCKLPQIPGKGPLRGAILSHDQVEAALMRGAGWDVRVVADEFESWEENPTNLPDFIKRDLRWCNGNLQYFHLLGMTGLTGMGRFQLVNAIAMYAGAPANMVMLAAGLTITLNAGPVDRAAAAMAFALYGISLLLGFLPRLLGSIDVALRGETWRYGGAPRMIVGTALDWIFSLLTGPIMMIAQTIFIGGLAFGRRVIWDAPNRVDRSIQLSEAVRGLWPQTVFGLGAFFALSTVAPFMLPWASPTVVPLLLAIPFAMSTASPRFGRWLTDARICAIPEEVGPG
ncbi:MAG: glucan biosynthesis glucosyltransferase [Novosphingobium sp.]|nr:glucan biosynthesis glucosyltransferase [Novosphingobium sp.]